MADHAPNVPMASDPEHFDQVKEYFDYFYEPAPGLGGELQLGPEDKCTMSIYKVRDQSDGLLFWNLLSAKIDKHRADPDFDRMKIMDRVEEEWKRMLQSPSGSFPLPRDQPNPDDSNTELHSVRLGVILHKTHVELFFIFLGNDGHPDVHQLVSTTLPPLPKYATPLHEQNPYLPLDEKELEILALYE